MRPKAHLVAGIELLEPDGRIVGEEAESRELSFEAILDRCHEVIRSPFDTSGAILGSMLGACGEKTLIPKKWVDDIIEWPRSVSLLNKVSVQLENLKNGEPASEVKYFVPWIFIRNILFLIIVLLHGFLRLLPSFIIKRLFP